MIVNITTIDDDVPEDVESFTATLSNAMPFSAVVISQPQAIINIENNDGKANNVCILSLFLPLVEIIIIDNKVMVTIYCTTVLYC